MWCDIHAFSEKKVNNVWEYVWEVDFWRNYSLFWFLAWVRNYDFKEPLSEPRWIPEWVSQELKEEIDFWDDWHNKSYFILSELLGVDYEKKFWNRRIMKNNNWASKAEEWEWKIESLRENLWEYYFSILEDLKKVWSPEDVRIVFWFDN